LFLYVAHPYSVLLLTSVHSMSHINPLSAHVPPLNTQLTSSTRFL
jgi:hypothetical protein